jgi:enolase
VSTITSARIRSVYDSRGQPTVEVTIVSSEGGVGVVAAPSGASTGVHEVQAFPDGGVETALRTFRSVVGPALLGASLDQIATVDDRLHQVDGTPNFARIGGNTATAASIAAARAAALDRGVELWQWLKRPGITGTKFPAIVGNCLNGGRHAIGGPEIQEFHAFAPEARPADAVRVALEVHKRVGAALHAKFPTASLGRGDEGGWVAPIGNVEAIELLAEACTGASDALHLAVYPGLDLAASEFFRDGQYHYREQTLTPEGQVAFLTRLVDQYGLRYLEDPFDQEAYDSFAQLTEAVGSKVLVVGDDLYTTRLARLQEGVRLRATNSILIKVNQVGTLSDTLATVDYARAHGQETITSHRSGDVPDGWLAQLAVATGAAGLKCGLLGGERVAKLNELLRLGAPHSEGP